MAELLITPSDRAPASVAQVESPLTMAAPIRKKRNFKGLGLDVAAAPAPPPLEPLPTRAAPAAAPGGKRRPPPMTLKAPKLPSESTPIEGENALLTVTHGSASSATDPSSKRMTYHTALSNTLANMDLSAETKIELKGNDEFRDIVELGQGNGGSVKKVEHVPTGTIMAKKVCFASFFAHSALNFCAGGPHRRETSRAEADPTRIADHA